MRTPARCRVLELVLLAVCWPLPGAQLPLRRYTTADGLANNTVLSIASDARGFLWFATPEGLSRFDGVGFANQAPRTEIRQILIGRYGNYWLATADGVIRFRPELPQTSADRSLVIRPPVKPDAASILSLLEDHAGTLWCGTRDGLYTIDDPASQHPRLVEVQMGLRGLAWGDSEITGLAEDAEHSIWIGASDGALYRRRADGNLQRFTISGPPAEAEITFLMADRQRRIWVGRQNSLSRSLPAAHPGDQGFERLSGPGRATPNARVFHILESRDGDVWVGMYRGLAQFPSDGSPPREWSKENGLPSRGVGAFGQDRDGNLWMGTGDQGAYKLSAGGMLTYTAADGLGMDGVISIAETLGGELYVAGRLESEGFRIGIRSGDGFQSLAPRVPASVIYFGWRPAQVILQDHAGEWWLASSQGLCRYPRLDRVSQLAQTMPKAVYTVRDGLPINVVVRLYEDRAGNIWLGTEERHFVCWNRSTQKFAQIPAEGTPNFATAFAEDAAGEVWIGDDEGLLWRVRNGRASEVAAVAGKAPIHSLLADHAGRLWVATGGQGLLRFDQPTAASPQFRQYGYAEGLSSLKLRGLAEDGGGSIYIGNGGGVEHLDADLQHVRHYTSADGLAAGEVNAVYHDRNGVLWFGTNHGLTRFVPRNGPASDPPPVWITGLSIAGRPAPVSEAGESSIHRVEIPPGQEHIQFDFVGLSYSPGNILRYQYRLGDDAWSAPIESRSVHYGALAPGAYRFAVRAINSDGEFSPVPATVEFQVVPQVWRRAWFQAMFVAFALAAAVSAHRLRAARLLELERVRSSIALDLHDDIASNLAQITIFSEIALREAGPGSRAGEPLARIAETARETVECISDIVWSIRPQKEGDLSQRIRRFGSDALTSRQIDVAFHFSDQIQHLTLDANARRQVYLIYKETVHNTVRHAQATAVDISMGVVGGSLLLKVSDNGKGMESPEEGNGLPGMRARAASLGGALAVHSGIGQGTQVELRVPLKRHWRGGILPQ